MRKLLLLPILVGSYCLFSQDPPAEKRKEPSTVQGRTVNSVTGEPVRDVSLTLRALPPGTNSENVFSDSDGRFSFDDVAPGSYILSASRPRFPGDVSSRSPGTGGIPLTLFAGQVLTGIEFKLTPLGVISGKVVDEEDKPAAGDPQVQEFQDIQIMASAVPPELGADALLQLLESGYSLPKPKQIDALRDIFDLAGRARFRQKMEASYGTGSTDTRDGRLRIAYSLNLDTESLRLRVIQLMLPLDPTLAREMFSLLERPALGRHACSSKLVYDPESYYKTLGLLTTKSFTSHEMAERVHVQFLLPYFHTILSPVQVVPLANTILSVKLDRDQLFSIGYSFEQALSQAPEDHRAFLAHEFQLIKVMNMLAELYERNGIASDGLAKAVRTYIVRNLTGVRCPLSTGRPPDEHKVVEEFNSWKYLDPPHTLQEISRLLPEDIQFTEVGEAVSDEPMWRTKRARELIRSIQSLTWKARKERFTLPERESEDWLGKARDTIRDLENWSSLEGESELLVFHEKCDIYETSIQLFPAGAERDRLLERYTEFLAGSRIQQVSPAEWYLYARLLLGSVRSQVERDGGGPVELAAAESQILAAFQRMRTSILSLYVRVEQAKRGRK